MIFDTNLWTWIAIFLVLTQSGTLSGLNLAYFSVSRLRLRIEAQKGNEDAKRILQLRENSNFLLATILWSNVAVNVLLALLSDSVMSGVAAFFFSTFGITIFGEIIPQAWFSRHAIRVGAMAYPLIRFYQVLFYPVARPSAWLLDKIVGDEAVSFYHERDLYELIRLHMQHPQTGIGEVEGIGAMNFLLIDDLPLDKVGRPVNIHSIVTLPFNDGKPQFPPLTPSVKDPFLKKIHDANQRWIVIVDKNQNPHCLLDADSFLKDIFFDEKKAPENYCKFPVIVTDPSSRLGDAMKQFHIDDEQLRKDTKHVDIILLWHPKIRRIITGKEILAKLLHGIVNGSD